MVMTSLAFLLGVLASLSVQPSWEACAIFSSLLPLPPKIFPALCLFVGPSVPRNPPCPSGWGADGHWSAAVDGQFRLAAEGAIPQNMTELE